jgi:hypothetical protein
MADGHTTNVASFALRANFHLTAVAAMLSGPMSTESLASEQGLARRRYAIRKPVKFRTGGAAVELAAAPRAI